MNSRNLFYVRNLQIKFFFKKNKIIKSLFFLENYLFSLLKQNSESLVVNLRMKWIYDQIKIKNFNNELTSNFCVFNNSTLQNLVLELIESFLEVSQEKKLASILIGFNRFNLIFNSIIEHSGDDFKSSVYFQFFQFLYINDFEKREEFKKMISNLSIDAIDNFENAFIEVFIKFYILKKKKLVRLSIYFIY